MQNTFLEMVRSAAARAAAGSCTRCSTWSTRSFDSDDFQGCIFVNVAMEFPLQHDPAHVAAARSKQAMEDIVAEMATQAGAANPRGLAQELCLVMEGVYVTRHVTGNPETIAMRGGLPTELLRSICRRANGLSARCACH